MMNMNMFFEFIIIILNIYLSRFIEIQTNVKTYKNTCKQIKYMIFFSSK